MTRFRLLKVLAPLIVVLSIGLAYVYNFTSLPMSCGIIKVPEIRLDDIICGEGGEINLIFSSSTRLEEFQNTSYLRLIGRSEPNILPYSEYYSEDKLISDVVLDCLYVQPLKQEKGRYRYSVRLFYPGVPRQVYIRLFFIRTFGYIYGTNQIEVVMPP